METSITQREAWVDNVKVIACVLVAVGHLFMSVTTGILSDGDLFQWFKQTIYLFHVPLFFICSGYLYQKRSKVDSFSSWKNNILKKALALGVPYLVFSLATWALKTVFSGAVNNAQTNSLVKTLFVSPTAPYWYLYALFFIFLITPTFKNKNSMAFGIVTAVIFKVINIVFGGGIAIISYTLANEIWFVIGMFLAFVDFTSFLKKKQWIAFGLLGTAVFLSGSILIYCFNIENGFIKFLLGVLICISIIAIVSSVFSKGQNIAWSFMARYTMPVFLMHTLCAAPVRIVLLRFGVISPIVHIILGLTASFVGPILIAKIMHMTKWLDFLMYPGKFIKIGKGNNGCQK